MAVESIPTPSLKFIGTEMLFDVSVKPFNGSPQVRPLNQFFER